MKKQINDLLLKMQTGENCIGETANHLLILFGVSHQRELLIDFCTKLEGYTKEDFIDEYLKDN